MLGGSGREVTFFARLMLARSSSATRPAAHRLGAPHGPLLPGDFYVAIGCRLRLISSTSRSSPAGAPSGCGSRGRRWRRSCLPLPRNVIAKPMVGRPVLSTKMARAANVQKTHGMCRWHGVCDTPGHHDRSGDLGGSADGGAGRGASAPSAGGPPPPDAASTRVDAHFRYSASFSRRWRVKLLSAWDPSPVPPRGTSAPSP